MALYAIGDTHLSEGTNKPMDVFGGAWQNYRQKLLANFGEMLSEDDLLLICGDFSWGMSLEESLPDFKLIDSFPGKKAILKGNHDYWWETVTKMEKFLQKCNINSLQFLHNNCIFYNGVALCGTRGWFFDANDPQCSEQKVFKRELIRLEASLKAAHSKEKYPRIFAFLHYPPLFYGSEVEPIIALLKAYGVERCYYGHLHGEGLCGAFNGIKDGIEYRNISADYLSFRPMVILE